MYITKGVIQVVNCYMYLNLKYSKYNCNQPLVQHAPLFPENVFRMRSLHIVFFESQKGINVM